MGYSEAISFLQLCVSKVAAKLLGDGIFLLPTFAVVKARKNATALLSEVQSLQFLVQGALGDSEPVRSLLHILMLGGEGRRDVETFQFV